MTKKYVVLVDERNEVIGKALKADIHTAATLLHRAFSLFIFNSQGELLLQQRNGQKKTWPLAWSNSCCGHPDQEEQTQAAVSRRLKEELGLEEIELWEILPNFRYRAERNGIRENEICPVYVGFTDEQPRPDRDEVNAIRWIPWETFLREGLTVDPPYSPWSIMQAQLLFNSEKFNSLFKKHTGKQFS